jgi:ABC-type Mn2+/Zn2+ transport system ATPase subunit
VRELSMGQRRRALFATALIGDPKVIILDEPLETMDHGMRDLICTWVRDRRKTAAVLVATHDFEPFASDIDSAIVVQGGAVRVVPAALLGTGEEVVPRLEQLASSPSS